MEEKKWCVYMHTNKINGKKYIGITSLPTVRRWGTKGQGYSTQYFKRAIDKYGWDNFEHEVLFKDLEEKIAKEKEIELIAKYKTKDRAFGYNLTEGGDGTLGVIISEETRNKLRLSHIGQISWNKGLAGKYKMSNKSKLSHIEMWKSEKYREKQRMSHLGNKHSEETKQKISKNSAVVSPVYQIDLYGNIINRWERIKSAVDSEGFNSSCISNCCANRLLTTNGYIFMYEKDYTEEKVKAKIDIINKGRQIDEKYLLKVYQFDMCGKFIKEYSSVKVASDTNNTSTQSIMGCLTGKSMSSNGYIWSRSNDSQFIKTIVDKNSNKLHNGKPRMVYKYDSNMNLLNIYNTCSDAKSNEDINTVTLKKYCISKELYKGFYWRMEGIE